MGTTLILGGTGFLGAHLVAVAQGRARGEGTRAGRQGPQGPPQVGVVGVVGVGRDPTLAPRFGQPRDGARWAAADLLQEGALAGLFAGHRFEGHRPALVVNAAALSSVGDCEGDPQLARRSNTDLPRAVAEACAASGARLLHVSSDLVFGQEPPPAGGFDEEARPAPLSTYGRTKRAGEAAVLRAHPAALVVRLPLLYGNSGGRGRGASDGLLEAVAWDGQPALFVDEWRTPLEVANAARALIELLHGAQSGLLHVAGPERVSRLELGLAVLEAHGLDPEAARAAVRAVPRDAVQSSAARPADVSLDARRARALLATPLLGVREGVAAAVR